MKLILYIYRKVLWVYFKIWILLEIRKSEKIAKIEHIRPMWKIQAIKLKARGMGVVV